MTDPAASAAASGCWVQRNIARFGGDPHNVTIAGQSAGGLSVLAQLVSPDARGLFQRAIVQSGALALTQQLLAAAEAAGEKLAAAVGCADQTAQCLRSAPVSDLVSNFGAGIPGVVDGSVLTQSIGTAIAHGRFARVPILAGIGTELPYLFAQPNAPFPATLTAAQQALAASMRAAWANFAATGDPSSRALPWPPFSDGTRVMSLVPPQPQAKTDFAAAHHCSFWAAG